MTDLASLLLPIVVSAVIVFLASSVIHMATPWHKSDYRKLPNEDKLLEALRAFSIAPGDYIAPCPSSMKDLNTPEFIEKMKHGPVMVLTVKPAGSYKMGKSLTLWFLYSVVIAIISAYVAGRALAPGADYLQVFRFVGVTAFVGYSLGLWQMVIWYSRSVTTTIKSTIDGLIYALLTAGTFGWLWPTIGQ
ncbi:MAG: hypothetical protein ABI882_22460 [Acidobacteriota bacterium]